MWVAKKIYERHIHLKEFLMAIGIKEKMAPKGACKMECVTGDKSFATMKKACR